MYTYYQFIELKISLSEQKNVQHKFKNCVKHSMKIFANAKIAVYTSQRKSHFQMQAQNGNSNFGIK